MNGLPEIVRDLVIGLSPEGTARLAAVAGKAFSVPLKDPWRELTPLAEFMTEVNLLLRREKIPPWPVF